jgi:hypothetical protein
MGAMRIDIQDPNRPDRPPVRVKIAHDPAGQATVVTRGASKIPGDGLATHPDWVRAFDSSGYLRQCPVCGCRELFARKDFPQGLGLAVVVAAAAAALVLFASGRVAWGFGVLAAVAGVDAAIYAFVPRCLVCYRCRSEFRDIPIPAGQAGWDLATGEKYRTPSQPIDRV